MKKKKGKKQKKKDEEFNGDFNLDFGTGNEKSLWQITETWKLKAKGKVCCKKLIVFVLCFYYTVYKDLHMKKD